MPNIVFGECLKFLLSSLDISNSRLSKAINVDSSLVNRWIHGKRVPPYHSSYVESISEYLSNNIFNTIQEQKINTLFLKVCGDVEVTDSIKEKIKKILLEAQGYSIECNKRKRKETNEWNKEQTFKVNNIQNHMEQKIAPFIDLSSDDKVVLGRDNILAAYNDLLDTAANQRSRKSNTIYITYNNLVYDGHLAQIDISIWYNTLQKVINKGWKIILLLRVNNNDSRSISFINYMMALVHTGKLMPYYIKNYDSITIGDETAIVPDVGVLSCFSVNIPSYTNCGLYIKSKPAIRIYQSHFQSLIAKHALPLVNIFPNRNDFSHYLADKEDDIGNRFLYKYCFSVLTLPEHLYWKLLGKRKRSNESKITSMEFYRRRLHAFLSNIQKYEYKDVYMASSINNLMKNHQLYLYSYEGIESIQMGIQDIIEYLENIIDLLLQYDNYKIAFLPEGIDNIEIMKGFCCVVKERATAIFESNSQFTDKVDLHTSITEPTLVKNIYDYCNDFWEHIPPANREKSEIISWLQYQVTILRQLI